MYKVGIIGPESTGKSTLARYLAKRYQGLYVPEYAREFVEQKGTTEVTWDELCGIARHQIEQIRSYSEAVFEHGGLPVAVRIEQGLSSLSEAVVFFDTELIVTKVWFDYAFGRVPEWLEEAVKEYPMDVYLLTYPDTPWVPDKARSNGSDEIRMELFNRYEREIQATDVPYYIIKHDLKI